MLRQEILSETIERYDELRRYSVNAAELGAAEAKLILAYRDLMPGNSAIRLSRSVARAALEADPRHVAGINALAETHFVEGDESTGYAVLSGGISKMIFRRDRLILQPELLKHLVPEKERLSEIQVRLGDIRLACKIGDCLENREIEERQQAKLYELATAVMPISDAVIQGALNSLIEKETRR